MNKNDYFNTVNICESASTTRMGCSSSSIPHFNLIVQIEQRDQFQIPFADLIDHILLLRQVISHPEMIQEGPMLDYFIKDYCKRMAKLKMITKEQSVKTSMANRMDLACTSSSSARL